MSSGPKSNMLPDEEPQAGPSAPKGTLSALWGGGAAPAPAPPAAAAARKRRRKDEQPNARLVFGANGVGVDTSRAVSEATAPSSASSSAAVSDSDDPKAKGRRRNGDKPRARKPRKSATESGAGTPLVQILSPDTSPVSAVIDVDTSDDDDEVVVVEAPRGPKKLVFSSDKGTAHSFFSRPAAAAAAAAASPAATSEADGEPAAAPSSAPTTTDKPKAKPKAHGFFSLKPAVEPGKLRPGWGSVKEGEEPHALWPGADFPSHVGGAEPSMAGSSRLPRRGVPPTPRDEGSIDAVFSARLETNGTHRPPRPLPFDAPPFVLAHPAIQAVLGDTRPDDRRETWCERHRPRTAAAVLGNELEATYLRDWLRALSVGSAGELKIVRRVPRRRALNPQLSWIVDDIGMFGGAEEPMEDIPDLYEEPELALGQRPDTYPPIDDWVANTILLTGPNGSGKSAAVHAAATELGWDVFEVYPGVGRRTGSNLLALVGDVGKNHMVGVREEKKSLAEAAKSFFGSKIKAKEAPSSQGSAADPIAIEEDGAVAKPEPPKPDTNAQHKQSLILIDEADILFDEESTFWPAVVGLIAESRRPVVITCNDPTRVPRDSLPLQTTLHFRPPAADLAQAYLAAVASVHRVESDIGRLYERSLKPSQPGLVDQPLPPNGNEPSAQFDLRAALTQLQLDRSAPAELSVDEAQLVGELDALLLRLDTTSFADAYVAPRAWARMEIHEVDRLAPGMDDEQGIAQLLKPDVQELYPTLAPYDRAGDIASALASLAGGWGAPLGDLQTRQTAYIRSLLPVLDPIVPLSARLLPDATLFLETMPFVGAVVAADDMLEAEDLAARESGETRVNRRTGRAIRITGVMEGMIHRRRQHPEAVDTTTSSPVRMPPPPSSQPSTPNKLYPPSSPRPGSPSFSPSYSPQSTAAALYANGAPLLSPSPSFANGYAYDADDNTPAQRAARVLRDAASSARAGFRDATRLERSVGLVWGDAELGSRVLKVALLNLLCLTLLSSFTLVIRPLLAHSSANDAAHHDLLETRAAEVGLWYNVLLSWPLFAVCFWINGVWGPDVARRAQTLLHPSYRHQPTTTSSAAPPSPAFGSAAWAWLAFTRILLISELTFLGRSLRLIPVFGRPVTLAYMSVVNAYYAFEFLLSSRQWPLEYRCKYISDRCAYMFGFGLPATLLTSFAPPLVNMIVFALIYPFFLIQALQSKPPSAAATLLPSTPSPSSSTPTTPTGDSFTHSWPSASFRASGPIQKTLWSQIHVPIFFFSRHILATVAWFADALGRDRAGTHLERVAASRDGFGKKQF
ncbi:Telomere length regulation protein elg1 [Vanrija pseudolonga]|uniref:Telomere length regulation protein elg1 n=1 Tax=Vanrija pseudolonga TaxID=143232 RepID=A0AAF0XZJ3_9TREE|nr:Telomere length regulation protein elg1 [Vanrija pseudolonga]